MTLQLQVFGPAFGEQDASPFCNKSMAMLTLANLDWQALPGSDSRKAPVGKLPVLLDGESVIHDSDSIRAYIEEHYSFDFDTGLTTMQRAQSRSLIRMVEEHLYFCLVYDRWVDDANWLELKATFFSDLAAPLRWLVPELVRRQVVTDLKGQGMGRLDSDEMYARAELDLLALETVLGESDFLFGDQVTAADCSVACVLSAIAASPIQTRLGKTVADSESLMAYVSRFNRSVFKRQDG